MEEEYEEEEEEEERRRIVDDTDARLMRNGEGLNPLTHASMVLESSTTMRRSMRRGLMGWTMHASERRLRVESENAFF